MASESSFLVDVYFEHSIEHASVFVSSAYPISVRDLIEVLPVKPYVLPHVLIEKQPSSTSLLTIKHALQEHGIPVSVQYRFIQDKAWGEPATLNLDDDTTLEEAWDAEDPVYRKAGKVRLVLQTTAGRVSEIHVGSRMMSGLPSEIVSWRHYISVLRCLVVKLDLSLGGGRWRELSEVIRELQESKSLSEQKMRKMLQDWERLVDHFDPVDINPRDKEENEASEQDFEGQFEQWNRQTQRILIKAVNEYRRKHDTSYKVTDLESRRAPALIQSEYMVPATLNEDRRNESQQTEFRGLKSNLESELLPIFDGKEKTIGHSLPNDIDPIDKESDGFVISSGILLWGQLPTVLAGSLDQGFQGNAESVPEMLPGGTIMRYPLKYRSAARVGNWKVRKAFSQPHNSAGGPTRHFGWVLYHEDVDPVETLERCSRVTGTGGISNGNQHVDKNIFYVNRYDWSFQSNPGATIPDFDHLLRSYTQPTPATEIPESQPSPAEELEQAALQSRLRSGYMLALDASHLSPAIGSLLMQDGIIGGGEWVLSTGNAEGVREGFGALTSMPGTEYELGWLVFSGRKHEMFPEADELVAIVYDGAYDGLGGHIFGVEI